MLELKIQCENAEEARIYLNAQQYHNLLVDFASQMRTAKKHGEISDVLKVLEMFLPDIDTAVDHHHGPY